MGGICDIRSESIQDREVDFTKKSQTNNNHHNETVDQESIRGLKSTYNKHENNTIKEENDEQSNMDAAHHDKHMTFHNKESERQKERESDEMNNENNNEAAVLFKNDAAFNNIATDEVICIDQEENNQKEDSEEEFEVKVDRKTDNLTVNKAKPEVYSITHGLNKELQKYKL
jgi:hypothetical protein